MSSSTNYPTTQANDNTVGTVDWELGFEDVLSDDDGFVYVELEDGEQSHYLLAKGFGFALPADATVESIVVNFARKANIDGVDYPTLVEESVRLVKSDIVVGDDYPFLDALTAGENGESHGDQAGEDPLWGESWTYADINSSSFGVAISFSASGGIYPAMAMIDFLTITVTYSIPGTGDSLPKVITLRASQRDDEPAKPRAVYAFNGDVILDPVVDDYYGGAVAVLRPVRVDGDDDDRRPLLSYVSASDFTESAVFAWQPQCLVSWLPDDDADELRGRRGAVTAPALVIAYESDCACFGSVVKGPSGNGTVTKLEAVDTQTSRNGTVVKGPSGSGTVSKPLCGC